MRDGSLRWIVETDGEITLGPEGKVTLRARFVAAPGRSSDRASVCGVDGAPKECFLESAGTERCLWQERISESVSPEGGFSENSSRVGQMVSEPGVGGGATRDWPSLMLLRVSLVEDEAIALLGRRVRVARLRPLDGGGIPFSYIRYMYNQFLA